MPLFKRKKDANQAPKGAPAIPGLDLSDNQSILSLAGAHNYGLADVKSRSNAEPSAAPGGHTSGNKQGGSQATKGSKADSTVSGERKYGTMNNISAVAQQAAIASATTNPLAEGASSVDSITRAASQTGHRSTPSSLSRSMSSGAVPYHLPWTRQLPRDAAGNLEGATDGTKGEQSMAAVANPATSTPPRAKRVPEDNGVATAASTSTTTATRPPPSSFFSPAAMPGLYAQPTDFRTSPSSVQQPSPSQRRQLMDTARFKSLKRSKAPSELNIVLAGAVNTGKTSFVRALLATCDLSLCTEEAKLAAAFFGISSDPRHPTYDTDPVTPLRTSQFNTLSGIDLHPNALIPIAVLESGASINGLGQSGLRPTSVFSGSRMSSATGNSGSGRVQLSLCDTPGYDFELEDEFEIERKTSSLLRYVEERLQKTLTEESKVQRQQRGDGHIHLVLYFIDPRSLLERAAARKVRRDRNRHASAHAAAAQSAKEQQQKQQLQLQQQQTALQGRARSTSMSHHAKATTASAATFNGEALNKQAQTAQLRQSMDAVQAKAAAAAIAGKRGSSLSGTAEQDRPLSRESVSSIGPLNGPTLLREPNELPEHDDYASEGLSQQEISILARLSERANVLPVIAKADTLTQRELDDVRSAVRSSIIRANLDLGAFEVDGARKRKKAYEQYRPTKQRSEEELVSSPTLESTDDVPLSTSPVKVIRIKSRRSYSATGERITPSTSGHSMLGHGTDYMTDDGHGQLGRTAPLFDNADEEEPDDVPTPEALAKMIPFTLFVPEPVRIREASSPQRKGSMNSIAEHLPPVPPLPRELARHKGQSDSIANSSDAGLSTIEQEETQEVLQAIAPSNGRESAQGSIEHSSISASGDTPNASPAISQRISAFQKRPSSPPTPSRRFQRTFRFGNANVLDARQCDFSLMRTCILGSHVDLLRDVTGQRYERYRSQRLEIRRLTRQSSATAMPTTNSRTSAPSASSQVS